MIFSCSQTHLFFLLPRFCILAETIFLNKVHSESRNAYFPIAALLLSNYFVPMDKKVRLDLPNHDFHGTKYFLQQKIQKYFGIYIKTIISYKETVNI